MEFSVVVPTFNEEHFLPVCLQSILQQEYERSEYEIIVSDANSTDRTADIAQALADKFIQTSERGIARGRNTGAKAAAGSILLFVDADTILQSSFLKIVHQRFTDPHIIGMTGIAAANDGTWSQRFVYWATYRLVRIFLWMHLPLFPGICAAYRRKQFFQIDGFREDLGVAEDLDLSRRISKLGKVIIVSQAKAGVSTRRLQHHLVTTVGYHIYNDLRYLLTGKAARQYPKIEETHSWKDLWKH